MTLKQYAQSKHAEFNWMTNALSSAGTRNVTEEHLKAAMDVVRRKFLVGLLNRKDESMERFEKYFEWIYRVHPKNQEKCRLVIIASYNSYSFVRLLLSYLVLMFFFFLQKKKELGCSLRAPAPISTQTKWKNLCQGRQLISF
jgi:hypothetical protein